MSKKKTSLAKLEEDARNITRRQFLNKSAYIGKVAASGAAYGALGNIGGRIADNVIYAYETTRDKVNEALDTLNKPRDIYGRTRDKISEIFGNSRTEPLPEPPEPESREVSRRGFLKNLLNLAYEHPVGAGTILGGSYGTGKQAVKGYSAHMDRVRRLEESLERTKDRQERLELSEEIEALRKEMHQLTSTLSPLEDKVTDPEKKMLLTIGSIGLVASIILSTSSLTGFSVVNNTFHSSGILAGIVFIVSLLFIKLGLRES